MIAKVSSGELELSLRLLPPIGSQARSQLDLAFNRLRNHAKEVGKKDGRSIWRKFFLIRDAFASLGPASVLTVHRSQGSSFGEVFVDSDVFWPNDVNLRQQLVYVAVSRARNGVWLVGEDVDQLNTTKWKN